MAFDDPVRIICDYLNETPALSGVSAFSRVPDPRPPKLIRATLTGSRRRSLIHRDARVTVECWAPTDAEAYELGAQVEQALSGLDTAWAFMPGGEGGWVSGPTELPDPDSGSPRVVMTANLRQRSH
ncbi:DUF3168 domain-containing protein [Arachnia propionica]|uniref:DUF3168 domain-containing protein n=1 Tax=Arachnia propionica TaxID=1750 RepID=A0A3P1T157_9ACTN|nr:DUF3168 domain-containing protein [Arachnia propionica]RRD03227.1 DUF3168 domain-containing protein [Arachnia propionica]